MCPRYRAPVCLVRVPYVPLSTLLKQIIIFRCIRKIAKSDSQRRHARPSISMEQLGSHWADSQWSWFWSVLRNSVAQIQVSVNSEKNDRYFTWKPVNILIISRSVFLRMRNISDKSWIENQNSHFMFNNCFVENGVVYEIIWKNIVEPGRPQMTIWFMFIACWMPKAANAHSD
jgi:hypothetical protein